MRAISKLSIQKNTSYIGDFGSYGGTGMQQELLRGCGGDGEPDANVDA